MPKHIKSKIVNGKTLGDIPRGETFKHCGHEWIVLQHRTDNSTLVITKDIIGNMTFDENNSNNWAKSTLRKYLNGEFLKEMCIGLSSENLGFSLFKTDLTADDGLKDYGSSLDIISLMTCDLYRKHRDIIEPIDESWWLTTPYSTFASNSYFVRRVRADGTLGDDLAHSVAVGVRPLCYLKSDTLIEEVNKNA